MEPNSSSETSRLHFPPQEIILYVDSMKEEWVKFQEGQELGTRCNVWKLKFETQMFQDPFLEIEVFYSLERDEENDFTYSQYATPANRYEVELDLVMSVDSLDEDDEQFNLMDWSDYEVINAKKISLLLEEVHSMALESELKTGLRLFSSKGQ